MTWTQLHDAGCPSGNPDVPVGGEGCTCTVLTQEELQAQAESQGQGRGGIGIEYDEPRCGYRSKWGDHERCIRKPHDDEDHWFTTPQGPTA